MPISKFIPPINLGTSAPPSTKEAIYRIRSFVSHARVDASKEIVLKEIVSSVLVIGLRAEDTNRF